MRAVALPRGGSRPVLLDVPGPSRADPDHTLVRTLDVGVCGTDLLLMKGIEGSPPPGEDHLVLGHEGLFEVSQPDESGTFDAGDLVVTSVRWPDPQPCYACAGGRPDLCTNDRWTEHGIRSRHGFMQESWMAATSRLLAVPETLRGVAVLLEPLAVVVKALAGYTAVQSIRPSIEPTSTVLGGGSIGLLVACCLRFNGHDVRVVDRVHESSLRARLVEEVGARYVRVDNLADDRQVVRATTGSDLVVEASGVPSTLIPAVSASNANGVVLALGTGDRPNRRGVDHTKVARALVQENKLLMGSVNASPRHLEEAIAVLVRLDLMWPDVLRSMIRRVDPSHLYEALSSGENSHVKTVINFDS